MPFNHVRASVLAAMLLAASPGLALAQNNGTATTPATTTTTPATTTPAAGTGVNGTVANESGGWGGGWWGLIGLIGLFGLAGGRSRVRGVPPATGVGTGPGNSRL